MPAWATAEVHSNTCLKPNQVTMGWQAGVPFEPSGHLTKFPIWGITVTCGRILLPFQAFSGLSTDITSVLTVVEGTHCAPPMGWNNLPGNRVVYKIYFHSLKGWKVKLTTRLLFDLQSSSHCLADAFLLAWPVISLIWSSLHFLGPGHAFCLDYHPHLDKSWHLVTPPHVSIWCLALVNIISFNPHSITYEEGTVFISILQVRKLTLVWWCH